MQATPSLQERIHLPAGQSFRLLRWQRNVRSVEVVLGPQRSVPLHGEGDHWHYHRATELTYVQRGAGTRFIADSIELFESGDLTLIGSNVPHYLLQNGGSAGISLQWELPQEHGIWSFAEAAALRDLHEAARRGFQYTGPTAERLRGQLEEQVTVGGLERIGAFLRILGQLILAPTRDARPLASVPFSLSGTVAHQEAMRDAVSYILARYRETVYLPELLRLTGMSRATFARQFRQHTGKSFAAFVNQVRLQAACRALRDSTDSVSRIALNHGFSQLSFFNRLFRREIGVSPKAFRQSQQ
jgi:AraC-like DNA-binding protein/mannose-6-phosphate isomerase-like protein (cupin superfamily)